MEDILTVDKLQEIVTFVQTNILNRSDVPVNLKSFLEKIFYRNVTLSDYSCCKFISVLYDAVATGSYDQLTREATSSKPVSPVEDNVKDKPERERKVKMNKKQFDLMAKRKLGKKERTRRAKLQMFAGNVQKLKKNTQYEELRKRFGNSVFVQFCDKDNTQHINNANAITEVDVYAKEEDVALEFISGMQSHAQRVQKLQDDARQVREEARRQDSRSSWSDDEGDNSPKPPLDPPPVEWAINAGDWGNGDNNAAPLTPPSDDWAVNASDWGPPGPADWS